MQIRFYPNTSVKSCSYNKLNFHGIKPKKQTLYDWFLHNPPGYFNPQESLNKIQNVQPQFLAGTKCKNSIPLRQFWDFFESTKNRAKTKNCLIAKYKRRYCRREKAGEASCVKECTALRMPDRCSSACLPREADGRLASVF